jgi:ribose transport system ATP-binding protein
MDEYIVVCKGMNKSFGPTKAVVDVDLSVSPGEIRGLIGENGSGKSTLCNLITGIHRMDGGEIYLRGERFIPASLIDAKKNGISILLQETGTIADLSVAENIFLGQEMHFRKNGLVSRSLMNEKAREVMDSVGVRIDPAAPIQSISFEDRKLIEVVRAIYDNPDLLIVDETTTALSQGGRDQIYAIMRKMKDDGKSVIFITHDLDELMSTCDSATVLRDGQLVKTIQREEFSEDYIRQLMIGRDMTGSYYRSDSPEDILPDDPVLTAREVSYGKSVRKVSLQLNRGEILGIGGLTDCGMHDLAKLLFGALPLDAGEVVLNESGKTIASPQDAIAGGLGYIPKDRDQESIFLASSIRDNVTMAATDKLVSHGLLSKRREKALARKETDRLSVKMQGLEQLVKALSGGNKQKVAVAKWLANDTRILIMDCPTRGIDIGVKSAIYHLMEELISDGCSILMISEELTELIGMSDRLLIMKDGRINGQFLRSEGLKESDIITRMI